ncbi:ABC transporter substrate-binding protein [Bradyrhizobium pachyrhizi]|uniref:ABC transporter substrate-binding protein n=1 Tax=Bradyrhizobium pachyrhizi TaxID=280333 RepID=UPI000A81D38E|nr:ABC transporter substrate-binding protein [Bradyrhizobium pachyrhizi]
MKQNTTVWAGMVAGVLMLLSMSRAEAQKAYGPGVTDIEIKIGSTIPLSGPASAASILGKVEEAYFRKINEEGGINGRKIKLITYDDGYSPPKTVEQTRRLVESDEVLLVFGSVGTATNAAVQKYLNSKGVPQLFLGSRAGKWNNPRQFPWTVGLGPSYFAEGEAFGKYLLAQYPAGKIGIIYQNDDFGKELLSGLKKGLSDSASAMLVAEVNYEVSEPTVDARVVSIKSSGANILIDVTTPKHAAQVIKKVHELAWSPVHIISSVVASIETVIKPAGLDASQDIITATYVKDGADPQWSNDRGVENFNEFLTKYYPEGGRSDVLVASGYISVQLLVHVFRQCGDDLTRENVLKQVTALRGYEADMLLPGMKIVVTPVDYTGLHQLQMMKLVGDRWKLFGGVINVGEN